ncbi:unnamed protein product [Angiostrongylus costaricensis]|uniref:Reverse transcriptase domain-containing protein n=1 Tax=Angiostrongylus costaricensis TaxID=334426 RepID=A0A0R3Q2L8_ANGCS|nr:unnamed protein product [Angiostrongylus costaricensis]
MILHLTIHHYLSPSYEYPDVFGSSASAQPNSACVMESFDVTALYTNVSNDSAMQAIFELLTQHEGEINIWSGKYYAQIRGLAIGQRLAPSLAIAFMSKVEAPVTDLGPLLYCRWSGKYYAQIRGLAMGQRLAPSLAIAFMSKVEAPVTDLGPLLYCRVYQVHPRKAERKMASIFERTNSPIRKWLHYKVVPKAK